MSIAEILEVEDFTTLEEGTISHEQFYKYVSNQETLEEELDDTEDFYEELVIPKEANQIEATHEHTSDLRQTKTVQAELNESYEELEIFEKTDQVGKTCENIVPNQQYATISLEETACSAEIKKDSVFRQNQGQYILEENFIQEIRDVPDQSEVDSNHMEEQIELGIKKLDSKLLKIEVLKKWNLIAGAKYLVSDLTDKIKELSKCQNNIVETQRSLRGSVFDLFNRLNKLEDQSDIDRAIRGRILLERF